jgi:hypothetical protein
MPHIPSKEKMIEAVRKSGCANLTHLPLDSMSAEEIFSHLQTVRCPCLARLLKKEEKSA